MFWVLWCDYTNFSEQNYNLKENIQNLSAKLAVI